jgi:hypothetical protein
MVLPSQMTNKPLLLTLFDIEWLSERRSCRKTCQFANFTIVRPWLLTLLPLLIGYGIAVRKQLFQEYNFTRFSLASTFNSSHLDIESLSGSSHSPNFVLTLSLHITTLSLHNGFLPCQPYSLLGYGIALARRHHAY